VTILPGALSHNVEPIPLIRSTADATATAAATTNSFEDDSDDNCQSCVELAKFIVANLEKGGSKKDLLSALQVREVVGVVGVDGSSMAL